MRVIIFLLAAAISGCNAVSTNDSVITAQPYVGLKERQNRSELKELTGVDPVRTEWCAAFVNSVLEIDNIPGSASVSDNPLMARSFLDWGERVERVNIQRGDVVVFPRGNQGWQGHVGFYVETRLVDNTEYWVILGGNQNNEVRYDYYKPNKAIGIRRYPINTNAQ
jgi:uncharacterized protein (TIGR02594 family)